MRTTQKSFSPRKTNFRRWVLPLLLLMATATACADDRALIDRTLDARTAAFNNRDVDAYVALISPDYVKGRPDYDPRREMTRLFSGVKSLQFQVFRRNVTFEADGTARVVQEYQLVFATQNGKTRKIKDVDHFLLKRTGSWPWVRWLIHQGLDQPAKRATPQPDHDVPASPDGGSQ